MVGRTKGPLAGNGESWPSLSTLDSSNQSHLVYLTPGTSHAPLITSRFSHFPRVFFVLRSQLSFQFLVRTLALRRCLACLCTAGAVLISPTSLPSLSLSLQCHQPGCRSADNPAARSALIRDKRCFLSAPAVGLGPGWDEALPWPGNPRPAAGSGLLTNGELCRDSDPDPAAEALQTLARASVS